MIKFDVHNRFTGEVQFTAEIDCTKDASRGVKLGLAVRWALENGANLRDADLHGAILRGADLCYAIPCGADLHGAILRGADLCYAIPCGADLSGADMSGADLSGAILIGHKIKRLIARITRISDGYEAQVYETEAGEIVGRWGCRTLTLAGFIAHAESYTDADKRAETLNIIAYVRAEAERLGVK